MRRGEGGWQTTARALQSTCEWNCFAGWGGSRVQRCVLFPWPKFFTFTSSESIRSMGESSGLQEKEGKPLTCITISHRRLVRREHFFYNNYQTLSSSSADSSRSWLHVENCTRVNTTIQVVSDFQRSCFFSISDAESWKEKTHSTELALQLKSVLISIVQSSSLKKARHEKLNTELKFNIGNTRFVLFCFFETVWSILKNGRFSHKHSGKRKGKKKNEKNSVITLGIVLIISTWLLPGFGNLFSCCWPIRVDFFAFNDFLWELMSDAAERRPNKKAERPFVVPEVIKPNHRAPWFAPCVFFHVCVCVQGCVCIHESKRERERERNIALYTLWEEAAGSALTSQNECIPFTQTHTRLSPPRKHTLWTYSTHIQR